MMRSMSLAISALRNHQIFMDVVSSNISNVNTTGFKGSRISFQELLTQTVRGSSAPRDQMGGLNPIQVGLGMGLASIDNIFTQGSLQNTGRLTDLAIQGNGFFALDNGDGFVYTRDGNLDVGLDGTLLNLASGMPVAGWQAGANGVIDTTQPLDAIQIPFGQTMAQVTSEVELRGNLDADATAGPPADSMTVVTSVYDSQGGLHSIDLTFTKDSTSNQWTWSASASDSDITSVTESGTTVTFDNDGSYSSSNPTTSLQVNYNNGADSPVTIDLDFSNITQFAESSNVNQSNQNGLPPGDLTTFSVSANGEVIGNFSNGLNRKLGQIALATFLNPEGLLKQGQSLFTTSANSGAAQVGLPGQDGRGQISSGYLEMSNVELAQEFTSMIAAQRGFQANSRVITTSDEMLQELVNLKR